MLPEDERLKLDNQLCFAFYTCSREITKLYRPLLAELGLTYTQYITMLALWERDDVGVSELGARLFLDSGTLTPLLKKLESMGFITRTRSLTDERSVLIRLTDKGRGLKTKATDIPVKLYASAGLRPEELRLLHTQLKLLLHKLDEAVQEKP